MYRETKIYFFKDFIYLLLERGERGEQEREGNINVWETHRLVASHMSPNRDPACYPGMCPDQELNQGPPGLQAGALSTEPHQPGWELKFTKYLVDARHCIYVYMYITYLRYIHISNNLSSLLNLVFYLKI